MKIQKLQVIGEKLPSTLNNGSIALKPEVSYRISGASRDNQQNNTIELESDDKILEFIFDDGTTWICDADTIHELFPSIDQATRSLDTTFQIPHTIEVSIGERGIIGGIVLKILNVFAKQTISGRVVALANKLEDKLLSEGEGLFQLDKNFKLTQVIPKTSDKAYLLFIHGTNSNTRGAFSKLADSEAWKYMHNTYGTNVIAFQHRTLTKSPLENIVDFAEAIPDAAKLHIVSHSRGGLLGEILCLFSTTGDNIIRGFSQENVDLLKKYNRDRDIAAIQKLNTLFAAKKIVVEKFVRIGCPAAGTRLASNRIDTILNVFFNLLGGSLNPVTDTLKELIAQTLKTKDDIKVLPGLEAQRPQSPFIKILNDQSGEGLSGTQLAVISGNGKLSGTLDGLYYILGRLFYGQRNDLVVNTDSMYLGAKRKEHIQYFFDQGAGVDHFNYFLNPKTREAISLALQALPGNLIPGFKSVSQYAVPASDRGLLGIEYGELYPIQGSPSGLKPILIFLPGIMGSNLSENGRQLWLAYWRFFSGGLYDLKYVPESSISATSIIKSSYKNFVEHFSSEYDIVIHPFDWRKQLNDSAKDLDILIAKLLKFNQPIKIVGHSMGGVLVRDFILNYPDTWRTLNTSKGFKLLYLGSPLGGSFRILTVLFGNDKIINMLDMIDRRHTKKELIRMFADFPGILSLLPLTDDIENDFTRLETWQQMARALGDELWPLPSEDQLATFKRYRDNINANSSLIDYSNMCYIAGKDKFTPSGYHNDLIPPRTELVFLCTSEGDQSVTWQSGIPSQMISDQSVYYVDATHGALANDADIFEGIAEILQKGSTNLLSKSRPVSRGEVKTFRMPEVFNFDFSERGVENAILGISDADVRPASEVPVSISISNGDLAYASYPVLAGHFENDGILYAESSIDKMLGGSLTSRKLLNLYPGAAGTNAVINTTNREKKFPGTIIVGLGQPGSLTAYILSKTVEQGIAKYLLVMNSEASTPEPLGISALIIGCGYGGLSLESAVKAIIEGVNNGNRKIKTIGAPQIKTIEHIEFVELLEDRALGCLYAVSRLENEEKNSYNIRVTNKKIRKLFGYQKRLPVSVADEWWNRISVRKTTTDTKGSPVEGFVFSASTGGAREEQQELFTSTPMIDLFIEQVSTQNRWTPAIAKTLFELMIPNEFKERLKRKGSINWIVDEHTASYPWELLQENISDAKPLCIGAGMIRQLATPNASPKIKEVSTELALVIGDPSLNGFIAQLDGAQQEALQVQAMLEKHEFPNITLINKSASQLILNLFSNDFKIIHLAGHGIFNPEAPGKSGMVIGKDTYLTTFDIKQLSTTPELVFVNCCHLGKQDAGSDNLYRDRFKLAANIGTQLICNGVKAVIAAGWAVNDLAATDFARIFYSNMLEGNNFGDSVKEARAYLYDVHGSNNTWGAYQCYGDPFYKLVNRTSEKKHSSFSYLIEEEALIDLNNLRNKLDTRSLTDDGAKIKLNAISDAISRAQIRTAGILELEAAILFELGEYDLCADKYDMLRGEESANFSVAALERLCNLRSKKCVKDYSSGVNPEKCAQLMMDIIKDLKLLLDINTTTERLILLGSTYKRSAFIRKQNDPEKIIDYQQAADYYQQAYERSKQPYGLHTWLILQSIVDEVQPDIPKLTKDNLEFYITVIKDRQQVINSSRETMDYWELTDCFAGQLTLVIINDLEAAAIDWSKWTVSLLEVWSRAGSKGKKIAEVENLEILSDALTLSTNDKLANLKTLIDEVKEVLAKNI